jgi:hypothetical protein
MNPALQNLCAHTNLAPLIRSGSMLGAACHTAGNSVATGANRSRVPLWKPNTCFVLIRPNDES